MPEGIRYEYKIIGCPINEIYTLEETLNKMSKDGWDLYMLNEGESVKGSAQYNCIFYREMEDDEENPKTSLNDFKSRIERMFDSTEEPYEKCVELQAKIKQKQEKIKEIKKQLDSTSGNVNYFDLNEQISKNLDELKELKNELSGITDPDVMYDRIGQDKLTISVSDELINIANSEKSGELIAQIVKLRQKLTDALGYVIPFVRFVHSSSLDANEYEISVRGIKVLKDRVYPGHSMFYKGQANLDEKPENAFEDEDVLTGQTVYWIDKAKTKDFWEKGLNPSEVIAKNLEYIVCRYVDEILDYSDINNYLGLISDQNLFLVEELISDYITIGDLRYIFAGLIKERVPVKDLLFIFERLNEYSEQDLDKEQILEKLRISLSRQICASIADEENNIYAIETVSETVQKLEDELVEKNDNFYLPENSAYVKEFVENINNILKEEDISCVITEPNIRLELFNLLFQSNPDITVIADTEMHNDYNFEVVKSL